MASRNPCVLLQICAYDLKMFFPCFLPCCCEESLISFFFFLVCVFVVASEMTAEEIRQTGWNIDNVCPPKVFGGIYFLKGNGGCNKRHIFKHWLTPSPLLIERSPATEGQVTASELIGATRPFVTSVMEDLLSTVSRANLFVLTRLCSSRQFCVCSWRELMRPGCAWTINVRLQVKWSFFFFFFFL